MVGKIPCVSVAFVSKDGNVLLFHTVGGDCDAATPFDYQTAFWKGMDQLDESLGLQHRPVDAFLGLLSPVLAASGQYHMYGYAPCSGLRIFLMTTMDHAFNRPGTDKSILLNEVRSIFQKLHTDFARSQCTLPTAFGDVHRYKNLRRQLDLIMARDTDSRPSLTSLAS